jgi:hypothetical protein
MENKFNPNYILIQQDAFSTRIASFLSGAPEPGCPSAAAVRFCLFGQPFPSGKAHCQKGAKSPKNKKNRP